MVAVFGGFAAGELVMFQQMGFGLGVAVLLDATIVRSVLVPATMALLGDRNWYLPRWLDWLPRIGIEARREAPAAEGRQGRSPRSGRRRRTRRFAREAGKGEACAADAEGGRGGSRAKRARAPRSRPAAERPARPAATR